MSRALWLGFIAFSFATASLFTPQSRSAKTETPVQLSSSLYGTHTHTSSQHNGNYMLSPGAGGPQDDPIEWVWQRMYEFVISTRYSTD